MPPSNSVSLVPRSGVLEYQGPPPLSVVRSTTLLRNMPARRSSEMTLSTAWSTLASTMSRTSCELSSNSALPAFLTQVPGGNYEDMIMNDHLLNFLRSFLGGSPTSGVWSAMKAR